MAYMTKEGKGPYPCDAGEYCGNHNPDSLPVRFFHESPKEADRHHKLGLAKMKFGRPHSCKAGTSAEMASRGWVGLYLKEDSTNRMPGDVHVDTPDELREPPE